MLFNSIEYLFFLPFVFLFYWILRKKLKWQNTFLLTASYLFYGLWDYRFLLLIIVSSLTDYLVGLGLAKYPSKGRRKSLLWASLVVNLGLLITFKYFNFFSGSLQLLFQSFGYELSWVSLNIILPVGISFYTFQTLSYTIDIYRGRLTPTKSWLNFFTYVAFFPQLVAGPIERAINLLPQIEKHRKFDFNEARMGMRMILWGLFKKVVVADNLARIVDPVFANHDNVSSIGLIIGLIAFMFQLYADFSGYSDIAIGTARLLGIKLMQNFATPWFSRDMMEFWRRWHISLSTWFRDYLFYPIGGIRGSKSKIIRNILIVFIVNGLWHGANYTFIAWGILMAIFFILDLITDRRKKTKIIAEGRYFPNLIELLQLFKTAILLMFSMAFFRASSISQSFEIIISIFGFKAGLANDIFVVNHEEYELIIFVCVVILMILLDWVNRSKSFALERLPKSKAIRYLIYLILSFFVLQYLYGENEYIYFQF